MERAPLLYQKAETAESLLNLPPQIMLVFDYEGAKGADIVMGLRSAVAASIYHSTLYGENDPKPKICCFAGAHKLHGKPGSAGVKEQLIKYGVDPQDIITKETTITTNTDIMQLHSYMKQHHMVGPAAIITTDFHIKRTKQELENHFQAHKLHKNEPTIYVIGPSSPELTRLRYTPTNQEKMAGIHREIVELEQKAPGGGLTEAVAYRLSSNPLLKKYVQPIAEIVTHPYTPPKLRKIEKIVADLKQRKDLDIEQLVETAEKIQSKKDNLR